MKIQGKVSPLIMGMLGLKANEKLWWSGGGGGGGVSGRGVLQRRVPGLGSCF